MQSRTRRLTGALILAALASMARAEAPPEPRPSSTTPVKLVPSDGDPGDLFGLSVALEGDLLLIGAPRDDDNGVDAGSAYAFERNGAAWDFDDKLLATDGAMADAFGSSVSLSEETGLVGAIFGSEGFIESGTAYAFTRGSNNWIERDELVPFDGELLDFFGQSVAVDGLYAVVGSPNGTDGVAETGAAYAFRRSGSLWIPQDKLVPDNGDGNDRFGFSIALDGDWAVIGAPGDDDLGTSSGAAYVFERSGTRWYQRDKLTASDGGASDAFGLSVSISGDTIVVGAPAPEDPTATGAAYVLVRDGNDWSELPKLLAQDGEPGDAFGAAVSISGSYLVVGAPESDLAASGSGSAHLFVLTEDEWIEREVLLPQPAATNLDFGRSVSVSGDRVLVGAPLADDKGADSGAAFVFEVDYIHTLTVTLTGDGSGTVTSSPGAIDCEPDCSEDFTVGTEVTLSAVEDDDSLFVDWGGDADCLDGIVTMTEDLDCTAQFDLETYELTIQLAGAGSGTVASIPGGISCEPTCSADFVVDTEVALDPVPGQGSSFAGWSGDPDCADGVVTMDADKTCIASFDQVWHLLTVLKAGDGEGDVTSSPTGIDCGLDCTQSYPYGTPVTLTPNEDEGSSFEGWSGHPDCSDGTVTMTSDITCIATFGSDLIFTDGFESGDTSNWSAQVP